jgi:hypothetical protein
MLPAGGAISLQGDTMRMSWRARVLAVAGGCSLAATACGSGNGLSPGGSYFQGLPREAVSEMLTLPHSVQILDAMSGAAQQSLAQAGVRNIIFCREELRVYLGWLSTGRPPVIKAGPRPAHPLQPGSAAITQGYAEFRAAVRSGDPSELQAGLVDNGSCGQWVPATPGTRAPTIAQVVLGQRT